MREDGRRASLALERVGRVYEEIYPLTENARDAAFADVRAGRAVLLREPRLREARADVDEAAALIDRLVDELLRTDMASDTDEAARSRCEQTLWAVLPDAATYKRVERRIEALLEEVWRPFEQRARVLDHFGYLDYANEHVTERGRWLADLRLDRPLLVGETIERNLFAQIDPPRAAGLVAALAADAERDYGELALDDQLVMTLAKFEQTAYDVASIEWHYEIEPVEELNFSAAAAATRWAQGAPWATLVHETRAEEGDLFRLLSRTGESLLQIAGLRARHREAAEVARRAAELVLRKVAEKCGGYTQSRQRPRGVERTAAWRGALRSVAVVDHVDQRLAADDDHGGISPEPRAIMRDFTVCTWEGERSPSRRRKRTPAAVRPIAAGS